MEYNDQLDELQVNDLEFIRGIYQINNINNNIINESIDFNIPLYEKSFFKTERIIKFLMDRNIIKKEISFSICGKMMSLILSSTYADGC